MVAYHKYHREKSALEAPALQRKYRRALEAPARPCARPEYRRALEAPARSAGPRPKTGDNSVRALTVSARTVVARAHTLSSRRAVTRVRARAHCKPLQVEGPLQVMSPCKSSTAEGRAL